MKVNAEYYIKVKVFISIQVKYQNKQVFSNTRNKIRFTAGYL